MRVDEMEQLPIEHPDHISNEKKQVSVKLPPTAVITADDDDMPESFKVGQRVSIIGGKHKKLVKGDETCLIQEVRRTFLVVQVSGPESVNGRSIQCHRKFVTAFKEDEVAEPNPNTVKELDNGGVEMPSMDDCVVVQQLPDENEQGTSNITTEINDVVEEPIEEVPEVPEQTLTQDAMNDKDEINRLKGVISDLEADIVSYRDMMLGHQNELEYLRKETGPSQEEKKKSNEKIIDCIKILLSLQ